MTDYQCDKHAIAVKSGQFCLPCMAAFKDRRDAATMTSEERAAEFRWWGRILTIPFSDLHQRIEELVGRGVWTHELASAEYLIAEIEGGMPATLSGGLDISPIDGSSTSHQDP